MTKAEINQRSETPKAMDTPILTLSLFPLDASAVEGGLADTAAGEEAISLLLLPIVLVTNEVGEEVAF